MEGVAHQKGQEDRVSKTLGKDSRGGEGSGWQRGCECSLQPRAWTEGSALAVMGPPLTSALCRAVSLLYGVQATWVTVNGSLLSLTAGVVSALLLNQP